MTGDYYTTKLSSNRLKQCYDVASERVAQYLEAEIGHVLTLVKPDMYVLELGCGYGRVLERLLGVDCTVVGIDTSKDSLALAKASLRGNPLCHLSQMNAKSLAFRDSSFDMTVCIQNGISAFKVEPRELVLEAVRVTRNQGKCLFSSYSDKFWEHRLEWFKVQSERGLLGEIDWDKTGDGVIVCKDGFRATTFQEQDFQKLTTSLGLDASTIEIDRSSVFCEIEVKK